MLGACWSRKEHKEEPEVQAQEEEQEHDEIKIVKGWKASAEERNM